MSTQRATVSPRLSGQQARNRLVSSLPVEERRLQLAGISTAVLEGGTGAPVVLLHGPGGNATHWMRVIPLLVSARRVIVPDLPGNGASEFRGTLDTKRVLDWLGELIDRTCASPPVIAGYAFGGAIAAHFAAQHPERVARLVLVDTLGLQPFQPTPEFGQALHTFLAEPSEAHHDSLWEECTAELDPVRDALGENWDAFKTYNVDRGSSTVVMAALNQLFEQFAAPAMPPEVLARITVPTALVWGENDAATPLAVARAASQRYGWPLTVIENCGGDPPMEEPEALVRVII